MHSILVRVNRKPIPFRGELVPGGSFAVVMSSWAEELGLSRQKLQRMLKTLEGEPDHFIKVKNVGNRFSIISVCNWGVYQSEEDAKRATGETTSGQLPSNQRATTGQQNKKEEKEKKEEKKEYSPEICDFVRAFQATISERFEKQAPKKTEALIKNGCEAVDKLIHVDGFEMLEVRRVVRWAIEDSFWSKNSLSLAQIRKMSDSNGLTKFQNIRASFIVAKGKTQGKGQAQHGGDDAAASDAWNGVLEAVRLGQDVKDTVASDVVRQIWGGLHGVGQLRPDNLRFARKDFITAYNSQKVAT